ncbi:MFS transporter [Phenylobacterium sp. LjRoot225]|uniref:MFS transporter n=1 Tax=Phenylobacterium sp. LjRoot225 TaxID=3342285 RepID=UPI003ECD0896
MAAPQLTAPAEWRKYGLMVLAAFTGFSFHSITTYSTGLFMQPLADEFGWSRTQITAGLSIAALMTIPLAPVVGAMIDRWGSRVLAIVGLVMTAGAVSAFGLANGSTLQWLALWTFYSIVATGIKSTVWTAAVTGTFSAARGLALGVMMCGAAAAQIVAPPLTRWLIETQGWRMAYVWLGAGWGGLALVMVLLFLYDAHDHMRRRTPAEKAIADAEPIVVLPGLSFGDALRSPAIIRIALSTLITMFMGVALIVHQVPILVETGLTRTTAAYLASLTGLAGFAGKLATGWMSDHWNAGLVGGITLAVPMIGFVMLLEPFRSPALIVISMFIIGYSSGAKLQIAAYLTSRYAGMRNFGKIFGIMGSLIAVGSGLGPVAAGAIYDLAGSYTPFILAGIPASLICGLLILTLGPYPIWGPKPQPVDTADTPIPARAKSARPKAA